VAACGALLDEYESLGQPAPPGFRTWPLEKVNARLDHLTNKGEMLRTICKLNTKLGGARLDWGMPEWSEEKLEAHVASLRVEVEETATRKEKAVILGRVEAALWKRNMDVPVALATLSTNELYTLYAELEGKSAPPSAPTQLEPEPES